MRREKEGWEGEGRMRKGVKNGWEGRRIDEKKYLNLRLFSNRIKV